MLFGGGPWRGSVGVVRGPVCKKSTDPVRSGGPRNGAQFFRVTPILLAKLHQSLLIWFLHDLYISCIAEAILACIYDQSFIFYRYHWQ